MALRTPNSKMIAPKTTGTRPTLPHSHANPYLLSPTDNAKLPGVKYQVITREEQDIVVGRIKIQIPDHGHAFVLRRFDTGAISQTTMFRAAFPSASQDAENAEQSWVKANFDCRSANSGGACTRLRLAGTWVNVEVAQFLAPTYNLEHIVAALASATPDSRQPYSRSTKTSPQKPASAATATTTEPHPHKRRRQSSPVPAPEPAPIVSPVTPSHLDFSTSTNLQPRRSTRSTVSPAPSQQSRSSRAKPPSKRTTQVTTATTTTTTTATIVANGKQPTRLATPAESDVPEADNDDIAEVAGPDHSADIAEQKELIARLKAERDARNQEGDGDAAMADGDSEGGSQLKRSREEAEAPLQFNFQEPTSPVTENRLIATNSRMQLPRLEPQQKSAAWGALWFAAGLAAAATIPSFFM